MSLSLVVLKIRPLTKPNVYRGDARRASRRRRGSKRRAPSILREVAADRSLVRDSSYRFCGYSTRRLIDVPSKLVHGADGEYLRIFVIRIVRRFFFIISGAYGIEPEGIGIYSKHPTDVHIDIFYTIQHRGTTRRVSIGISERSSDKKCRGRRTCKKYTSVIANTRARMTCGLELQCHVLLTFTLNDSPRASFGCKVIG